MNDDQTEAQKLHAAYESFRRAMDRASTAAKDGVADLEKKLSADPNSPDVSLATRDAIGALMEEQVRLKSLIEQFRSYTL